MLFTNFRTNNGYTPPNNNTNNNNNTNLNKVLPMMPFSNKYLRHSQSKNVQVKEVAPLVNVSQQPVVKKMKWGEPTWFLFHTLAHKIKDEHFSKLRMELLQNIAMICNNLPCPTCSEHATQYINRNPFYSIQTKQGLKDMLFQFHNEVNKNKGFQIFSYDLLDSKYNSANTVNIIQNFMFYFQDKSHSIRMIANDMHRARLVKLLKDWFNANLQYFNM
jgi:hypothetical protein